MDTILTEDNFYNFLRKNRPCRKITAIHNHHTWKPRYNNFTGKNHQQLNQAMRNYHVNTLKWLDIGHHFTTFRDGKAISGRTLEKNPACIKYNNKGAICLEHLGNFDYGGDQMSHDHENIIIAINAMLAHFFKLPVDTDHILYHHWFDMSTGKRTNGNSGSVKSCPGNNFFGGNKIEDCRTNFLPRIRRYIKQNL